MGGNKKPKASEGEHPITSCVARYCTNSRPDGNVYGGKKFFNFPSEEERCRQWVRRCRRADLMTKSANYLSRNYALCSDHFDRSQFLDRIKSSLVYDAVPTKFNHRRSVSQTTPVVSRRSKRKVLLVEDYETPGRRSTSTVAAATALASMTDSLPAVGRSVCSSNIKTDFWDGQDSTSVNGSAYYEPIFPTLNSGADDEFIELDVQLNSHVLHLCKILPAGCSSTMQVEAQNDKFLKLDILKEGESVKFSIKGFLKDLAKKVDNVWQCQLTSVKGIKVDNTQEMQDYLQQEIRRSKDNFDKRIRDQDVTYQKAVKNVTQKVNHAETNLSSQKPIIVNIVPKVEPVCLSTDEQAASSETSNFPTTVTEFVDNVDTGSVSDDNAVDSVSDGGVTSQEGPACFGLNSAIESQENPLILSVERVANQVVEAVDVDLSESGLQGNLRIEPLHMQSQDDHNYHIKPKTPEKVTPVIQVFVKGDNPHIKVETPAPAKSAPQYPETIKHGIHRATHPCPITWCDRKFMAAGYVPKHMKADHSNMADFDRILAEWQESRKQTVAAKKTKKERFAMAIACPVCRRRCSGTSVIRHFKVWHSTLDNFDSVLRTLMDVLDRFKMKAQKYVKCPYCEKLVCVPALRRHKLYHCKNKPDGKQVFSCGDCGFHAASSDALESHKNSHVGTLYECRKCNKSYNSESSLKSHRIVKHEARGPLPAACCPYCPRKFNNVTNFQRHFASHTGEASFSCDQCNKTFSSQASMIGHKRSSHETFTYRCQTCGIGFERSHQCLLAPDKSYAEQSQQDAKIIQ